MATVVRITRHPFDSARETALKEVFGDELRLVDRDIPFGENPIAAVQELMQEYGDVVALEVVAPIPVLARLVGSKRELGNVLIIRAEFLRGPDGRAAVIGQDKSGRDIFGFSHYEVVEEVLVKTRLLSSPTK